MVEWRNGKLFVGFHEWAWSRRTEGFGVYAILGDGSIVKVGITSKRPVVYDLPDKTVAVFRFYESNRSYVTLYLYLKDGKQYTIDQKENFRMPDELDDKIKEAIIRWLNLE